ncbi:MAG: peptide deformylase [Motiliproteus sp.]
MALLNILEFPDPRLRTRAKAVKNIDDSLLALIDDMFETMYAAAGIGLAATQIDVHLRLVVMDLSGEGTESLVLINPEVDILDDEREQSDEGCLSVPGYYETVERANHIRLRALGRDGKPFELEAKDLLAVCIQHELDHLVGKLFVDYISPLKRTRIRSKLEKKHRLDHQA